ncbi:hypothetical protein PPYR_13655 [Photinus pyralis]|uniref:DUF5641 domain-containing protein n=1 Tax=Photinus pyralis TaxID=7054 RepID=A0A5N4A9N6_PHOPY|nr:hypothetical protein PPYR_13655 [Photinus pyralis]
MLRWTLMLSAYDYELRYVPGAKIQNADALSRLPQKIKVPEPPPSEDVLMLENIPEKLISAREIAQETKRDPVLSRVMQWIWKGWPDNGKKLPDEFTPYLQRKHELNCYQDCLLWGTRVIVPLGVRDTVLKMLHSAHPGRSPAEILMGRKLNTVYDRMQPDFRKEMMDKQEDECPIPGKDRVFQDGDAVFARSFTPGSKWLPAQVVSTTGPVSYRVQTPDGQTLRRHSDQIRARVEEPTESLGALGDPEIPPTTPEAANCSEPQQQDNGNSQVVEIKKPPERSRRAPKYLEDFVP